MSLISLILPTMEYTQQVMKSLAFSGMPLCWKRRICFTGTPLLKTDKQKSIEVFGRYIHTYKFDQAVCEGVVLDLRYEARDIDQHLTSKDRIDQWFEAKTKGLNDLAKAQLKQKWGTMQRVLSSQSRLEWIVADILLDMNEKLRLMDGHGNAMLVAGSITKNCGYIIDYKDLFNSLEGARDGLHQRRTGGLGNIQ